MYEIVNISINAFFTKPLNYLEVKQNSVNRTVSYFVYYSSMVMNNGVKYYFSNWFFCVLPCRTIANCYHCIEFLKKNLKVEVDGVHINTDNKVKTFWLQVQQHYSLLEMIIFRVSDCSSSNLSISLRLSDFLWSGEDLRYPLGTWKNLIGKNSLINMKSST